MNIGDRVRFLHSSGEGIITKLLDNQLVEVEIEEGFHIPVKMAELVPIAQEESRQFQRPRIGTTPSSKNPSEGGEKKSKVSARLGIYVAFTATNDRMHAMHLINNTDYELPFTLANEQKNEYQPLLAGKIGPRETLKVQDLNVFDINDWGIFIFQFLFLNRAEKMPREPLTKRARFRAKTFFTAKQKAPLLEREAYLFQIDLGEVPKAALPSLDPEQLKNQMLSPNEQASTPIPALVKPPKIEVDLHIETITKDFARLNAAEILELQLKTFEQNLESALVHGLREITFIHGVGNGRLRQEIHRRLSSHSEIQFFQDAQKEKFGYGATLVRFKA
ncbi:MAG: Smr/MutS family protein [Microscillaceae bacterium]|nr:Smr/MutS family protein [Microscillaceae bacterium]